MEAFIAAAQKTVQYLLGNPQTIQGYAVLAALGFLSALFLYGRMAKLTDMTRTTAGFVLLAVLMGFILTIAGMVLADMHVIPRFFPQYRGLALVGATLVGALLFASPVLAFLQRGSYGSAAFSWCIALAMAAFVVVIARAGFDLVESGEKQGARVRARSEEIESFLESK